jgi:predicted nucleic acid-binding protein
VDRVFLDANVLFSAAWRDDAGVRRLWSRPDATLITSAYAAHEAQRNLATTAQRDRLAQLLSAVRIVPEARDRVTPRGVALPEKDLPILLAALAADASHLLTGDVRHFGPLSGQRVGNTLIQCPAEYLHPSGRAS